MWARKPNSEKLVLSRLEISLCKVCRVDIPVSHIFAKKSVIKSVRKDAFSLHILHTPRVAGKSEHAGAPPHLPAMTILQSLTPSAAQ